ncbi:hypothetical protein [Streptomyces atriruber]|uniref:hypothetical protein n=1 Tax=Streptomyces atriruber TaxID=545121 RepID=UPI00099E8C74|nr:hypothetical protein [Streptomyces atriruber]
MTRRTATRLGPTGPSRQEQPADGRVEARVVAAPDTARQVALLRSRSIVCDEPRGYPTGSAGGGTRPHLTVDTLPTQVPGPAPGSGGAMSLPQPNVHQPR